MSRATLLFSVLGSLLLTTVWGSSSLDVILAKERFSSLKERIHHIQNLETNNINKHSYVLNASREIISNIQSTFSTSVTSANLPAEKESFCQYLLKIEIGRIVVMNIIAQRAARTVNLMTDEYGLMSKVGRAITRIEILVDGISLVKGDQEGDEVPLFENIYKQMDGLEEDLVSLEKKSSEIVGIVDSQIEALKDMQAKADDVKYGIQNKLSSYSCLKN